jgi:predicted RND superfamily exporter protein
MREKSDSDPSTARAAILPPLVLLAGIAPLSISALPALRDFGRMTALLLALQLVVNCFVVPQIGAWTGRR